MMTCANETTSVLDLLDRLVDDRMGVLHEVREVRRTAGAPDFVIYTARTCNLKTLNPVQSQSVFWGTGVAIERERAMTKAVGEAIERYCSATYYREDYPLASYASASFPCVKPGEFVLYTKEQYREPGFPFVPFNENTRVRWVPAFDLHSEEAMYLPASLVFLGYIPNQQSGEQIIAPQISTGLSCHTSFDSAAIAAICEVVERDAVAITWQGRLFPPKLDLTTLSAGNLDLVERLKRPGSSMNLFLLTMDHSIPVVLGVVINSVPEAPAMLVSAAAHLNPEEAVRKSLEELAQVWSFAQGLKSTQKRFSPKPGWTNVTDPSTHAAVYFDHANLKLAEFLFSSTEELAFDDIRNLSTGMPSSDLRLLVKTLHDLNQQVLLADITSEEIRDLGLSVVRTVIPGFHPLYMGHRFRVLGGTRLWKIPQQLGYPGITPDKGDNPFPHPFP